MKIREVARPTIADFFGVSVRPAEKQLHPALENIGFTGSGKGSIALILEHLYKKGVLTSKLDEILVPDWLGYWVYNQIQPYAFPVKHVSERTKAVLVYHQYGFAQDMKKIMEIAAQRNLIVIEDCAHAVYSFFDGKRLGSFGNYSLYSFSKFMPCFALGAASSADKSFAEFVAAKQKEASKLLTLIKDTIKYCYERSRGRAPWRQKITEALMAMSYATYGQAVYPAKRAIRLVKTKLGAEIAARQENYQYFRSKTEQLGICNHLEADGVTPYVIPIRLPVGKEQPVAAALQAAGIETGVYQFDINRNIFESQFVPVVWVPCHGGVTRQQIDEMIDIITAHC